MSWQRAVFFGGAVLVLSACADATAPSTLRQVGGTLDAKKAASTPTSSTPKAGGKNDDCTGIVIHVGLDGSLIPTCVVIPTTTISW